jgi:general secretion pathway protein F
MPAYSYRSTTQEGVIMEGVIEAHDEKSVLSLLKNSGLIPLKIKLQKKSLNAEYFNFKSAKNEVQTFTTELYALLSAGLPLDRCLNILAEITENKKMKDIISSILRSIREGSTFSDALEKHPHVFSGLYVNMIRAGEAGGVLGVVLEKLIDFLESSKELKDHIFSALIYPAILVVTGIISIIVLVTYVLPKFSVIFRDLGTQLPLPTQILISISNVIISTWWIIILIIIGVGLVLRNYLKTDKGRYNWDALKIKIMGDVILKLEDRKSVV